VAALLAALPVAAVGAFALNAAIGAPAKAPARKAPAKKAATNYIQGTVTSAHAKPEAGVWVIAEAKPAGTVMRKIVVTDRKGRFVLPQLPNARYKVWVRGYGLLDSKKVSARPGADLHLHARTARSKRAAAQIYPANYWLSMLTPPAGSDAAWADNFKGGCMLCHQIGSKATRSLVTREAYDAGTKKVGNMYNTSRGLGRDALLDSLADWSGRIAKGETPKAPPRPRGRERNMVITQWNWGDKFTYGHDEVATDRNNPRRNANGPVWGVDIGNDWLLRTDPVKNTSTKIKIPTRNGWSTPWEDQGGVGKGYRDLGAPAAEVGGVSAYVGVYKNPANPHNPMMDAKGRVWMTTQIRDDAKPPAFCQADAELVSKSHHRQLGYYDPKTKKFTLIDTCFGTHHLQFDKHGKLWVSGDSYYFGWFDPSKYDPTHPETEATAQGWSRMRIDTNGDGVAETKITGFNYGVIPNDKDGSVWSGQLGAPGAIVRYDPATDTFEKFSPDITKGGYPRGVDSDSKGIIWVGLGSGHLASFDRSKCTQTWGDGTQCPQGWTYYKSPGPYFQTPGGSVNADFHYYVWVDKYNTLGMGKDTPVLAGTDSDSLLAFSQKTKKFTVIRIPYPLNGYMRGLDGRIDNPRTGWKGRGLWWDSGIDPVLHIENQQGYVAHVQMRPTPLAR
jgi:streptogramin lyase